MSTSLKVQNLINLKKCVYNGFNEKLWYNFNRIIWLFQYNVIILFKLFDNDMLRLLMVL